MGNSSSLHVSFFLRLAIVVLVAIIVGYCFIGWQEQSLVTTALPAFVKERLPHGHAGGSSVRPSKPHAALRPGFWGNLSLSESQCQAAFPGLTREIDHAVASGAFGLRPNGELGLGPLQLEIKNQKISILDAPLRGDLSREMRQRQLAALHQLYTAVLTSPSPLPDTIISLSVQDAPVSSAWSYSRPAANTTRHIFPMPHFAFWAWPLPFVGSLRDATRRIDQLEEYTAFRRKDPRAVWRGTVWFNNGAGANPRLRQDLVKVASKAVWANVEALRWRKHQPVEGKEKADGDVGGDEGRRRSGRDGEAAQGTAHMAGEKSNSVAVNAIPIHDFCRHKYIIYTEGVSYSGRLHFHQLCHSVLITPPLEWMQHTTHLLKPVFSTSFLGDTIGEGPSAHSTGLPMTSKSRPFPSPRQRAVWPTSHTLREANAIFVRPDWSDLEATVRWLEAHPDIAEGIATRQRETFARGGYLSPAAEACYWRALIQGWSQVADTTAYAEEWANKRARAISFEEFVLADGQR